MRFTIFLLVFFSSLNVTGQLKQKIADERFMRMEYAMCVDMYDELADKYLKNKSIESSGIENIRRAAISNFQLFRMKKSCYYYTKLQALNKLNEKDREWLIQAHRYLKDYSSAFNLSLESSNLFTSNQFFKKIVEDNANLNSLLEDSLRYRIYPLDLNSDMGDFAPAMHKNHLYYATKSANTKAIHTEYGWDDSYYLNIKIAELTSDSTTGKSQLLRDEFITKAHDGPVSFNSKGDQMVITRNSIEKVKGSDVVRFSLYFSNLINNEWTEPKAFPFNNASKYNTGHAVFAENDQVIYFSCDKEGGSGLADLYSSRIDKNGNWAAPVNLGPNVNTNQNDLFPFVTENVLYFASAGHFGLGGLDIFSYELGSGMKPKNSGYPINTSYDDFGLILDSSNTKGFFSSNRADNIDRLYAFKYVPMEIYLQGIVYAAYTEKESIPSHPVYILNETAGERDTIITNEFGQYHTKLEKGNRYRITTSKDEFVLITEGLISTQGLKKDTTFYCELPLKPTTLQVRLRVVELGTNKIIEYAKTTITDYVLNKESILYTDETGIVIIKVDRNKTYWAHASKKGFVDDNVAFNSANENDKIFDLELKLPPIVKGDKFKLENIFYDLNKSTLRPESKLALDKLADFIIKNDLKIELSSHTDARGSDAYNLKLSQARAQSCVDYLYTKGVKKAKIIAKGYGETQLINRCKNNVECPEELHQDNRRTEVKIL